MNPGFLFFGLKQNKMPENMFWIPLASGITVSGTESNNKHKPSHLDFSHGLLRYMSTVGIWPMDKITAGCVSKPNKLCIKEVPHQVVLAAKLTSLSNCTVQVGQPLTGPAIVKFSSCNPSCLLQTESYVYFRNTWKASHFPGNPTSSQLLFGAGYCWAVVTKGEKEGGRLLLVLHCATLGLSTRLKFGFES